MPRKTRGTFDVKPFFTYATGSKSASGRDPKKKKPKDVVTTQMVGEEGEEPPPGTGKPTTPAMGEEGVHDVPTTTIARGEETSS